MAPAAQKGAQLDHLTGARFLAALWIVCAHYLPKGPESYFNDVVYRVNVAVCFFVVASGFVTHWAYGGLELSTWRALGQFYVRRLGRVVFTFWVALAFACAALGAVGERVDPGHVVRCALFVDQWVEWCPNGPSWFVFALLPSWLLYPLVRRLVNFAEDRGGFSGLATLLGIFWGVSFCPGAVLFVLQDGNITMQQHGTMTFWPPAQCADFAIGVVTAALVRDAAADNNSDSESGFRGAWPGRLADAALLAIAAVAFLLPRPSGTYQLHLNGWEPLLDHGLALLIAAFLYGSCAEEKKGWAARLLRHETLVALGVHSFEVYIFQRPFHDTFGLLFDTDSVGVFVIYLLALWGFAGVYTNYVQASVDRWLRWATAIGSAPDVRGALPTVGEPRQEAHSYEGKE